MCDSVASQNGDGECIVTVVKGPDLIRLSLDATVVGLTRQNGIILFPMGGVSESCED